MRPYTGVLVWLVVGVELSVVVNVVVVVGVLVLVLVCVVLVVGVVVSVVVGVVMRQPAKDPSPNDANASASRPNAVLSPGSPAHSDAGNPTNSENCVAMIPSASKLSRE